VSPSTCGGHLTSVGGLSGCGKKVVSFFDILEVNILEVDILEVNILEGNILEVDILEVNILEVDILEFEIFEVDIFEVDFGTTQRIFVSRKVLNAVAINTQLVIYLGRRDVSF
jgi:hypothetical protein